MSEKEKMQGMPYESGIDHTIDILKEGYTYISDRQKMLNEEVFKTTILGQEAYALVGKEASELFYDTSKFRRSDAMPKRILKSLQGQGGVQTLDGKEHEHRKKAFMSLMGKEDLDRLGKTYIKQIRAAITKWTKQKETVVYEEAQELMVRTACEWAGVPLKEKEVEKRTKEIMHMIVDAASVGISHWKGTHSRNVVEDWVREMVEDVRAGKMNPPENTALYVFSWHRDLNGELLDPQIATVEVLNIVRPMAAISVYIQFLALSVIQYPEEAAKLSTDDQKGLRRFVQEVRRFYPFFPAAAAKTTKDFEWHGYEFKKDTLTLLDLYGTNHDASIWENPDTFDPDRFKDWDGSPFSFIPQGGGDFIANHRCAGEWVTILILTITLDYFANKITYTVPNQDLLFSLSDIPSLTKSGVRLENVQWKTAE
ncbi:cytochrome P450 [Pisciglobus halotolerans]|uniref:Fatty-acid peroxygenase n=1 Tax=Pisciglobus halotolerans TaxID=745365 RepID=A0A1I3CQI1_9LACT|nr:cytochrome P450 [Pisciglobus halotolerans]SFH76785.1 fatty-acid peroxygenase [Pisciglobus halotolerans]